MPSSSAWRQSWGLLIAAGSRDASQFESPVDRAHRAQARIKARLIGDHDPDLWELPPKPKWMRWTTYSRLEEKYDHYEWVLNDHLIGLVARLTALDAKRG